MCRAISLIHNDKFSPQRHRGAIIGMLEYWNGGILGKGQDQRPKQSGLSRVLLLGFPIFQNSIIPSDFAFSVFSVALW
jgi:hypothetical protein